MRATPRSPRRSERRQAPAALALLLLAAWAGAAPGPDRGEPRREPLDVELTARFAEDGAAGVAVTVAMPYRSLVFTRTGDAWTGELRVTVSARRDGRTAAGAVGAGRAVASDYAATRAGERLRVTVPVDLPDDRPVTLAVRAEVPGTARWWERELEFAPGAGRSIPWAFAGFGWNLPADHEEGLRLDALLDSLRVTVDLAPRPARALRDVRPTSLILALHDGQGAVRELARLPLPAPDGGAGLSRGVALDPAGLPFGLQTLSVRLEDDRGVVLPLVPDHPFVNLGVPFADDATWRRHVGWLEPRNDRDADLDALARLPRGERAAAWRAFWDARPPDARPDETEHLLRIVEADRRFGRFGRGALSDRGRYFVRYGPPASVDSHVMDAAVAGDWEVWYYPAEGFRVIFHDAYGLGDFREYARMPL